MTSKIFKPLGAALAAVAMFMCASTVNAAAEQAAHAMVVYLNDGSEVVYMLGDSPVVSIEHPEMVVTDINGEARHHMGQVLRATVENRTGASVSAPAATTLFAFDGATLNVTGLSDGAKITVCDLQGHEVAVAEAGADGSIVMDCTRFGTGIYVVSTPVSALKIRVR